MEAAADAVSAIIFYDAKSMLVGDRLNGATDVRKTSFWHFRRLNSLFQTKFGDIYKFLRQRTDVSDAEHG